MSTLALADSHPFPPQDRRRHARLDASRPCKVYRPNACRYAGGLTQNLSASGALILIDTDRPIALGERLDVAVAWSTSPVVAHDALVQARAVRVEPGPGGRQLVAVEYAAAAALAQVA